MASKYRYKATYTIVYEKKYPAIKQASILFEEICWLQNWVQCQPAGKHIEIHHIEELFSGVDCTHLFIR